jgi:hypothetical protein
VMKQGDFDVKDFLDDRGIEYDEASSGRQVTLASCPSCGKSKKFYINLETGQFMCHYCASRNKEMSGGAISLVMLLGDLSKKEAFKLVMGREVDVAIQDDAVSSLLKVQIESFNFHKEGSGYQQAKLEPPTPIRVPIYMLPINKELFPEAWNYLTGRGIPEDIIPKLGVLVSGLDSVDQAARILTKDLEERDTKKAVDCMYQIFRDKIDIVDANVEKELIKAKLPKDLAKKMTDALLTLQNRGRIIFPVILRGHVFGWVARDITGQNQLKVRNSAGQFKFFCAWNFDQAQASEDLVICEGIVSAIKCGVDRTIATLGKIVTPQQLTTFKKMAAKSVFVCLDPDAQKEAMELKRRLIPMFKNVYNVSLPPLKLVKCPKCGVKHEVDTTKTPQALTCQCGHAMSQLTVFELLKKSDYKDAGDYSIEEMDKFIQASRVEDTDGFLFGSSVFDD